MKNPVLRAMSMTDAQTIMGSYFIDPSVVGQCFGFDNLKVEPLVPFSGAELRRCASSHVLFPGYPVTFRQIRERHPKLFAVSDKSWGESEPFVTSIRVELAWYLIQREPKPNFKFTTWDWQTSHLSKGTTVPTACELAFACVLFYSVRGIRLFEDVYLRTQDHANNGLRVAVGDFDDAGIGVIYADDNDRNSDISLVSTTRRAIR